MPSKTENTWALFLQAMSVKHQSSVFQTDLSSRADNTSPSLPAVKLAYCHTADENSHRKSKAEKSREKHGQSRQGTTLPPSPNGFAVQNGVDTHHTYKRRSSSMRTSGLQTGSELPEVTDTKDITRRSSKLAREIFEKYNMKSATQTTLPSRPTINGMEQYSMPWRNKTFLSLPLRFNGNIQQRYNRPTREKTNITDFKYDVSEVEDDHIRFTKDWNDLRDW